MPGLIALDGPARSPAAAPPRAPAPSDGRDGSQSGDQGHGFFDELLDILNPLQHVPLVGTVYRALTGDHLDGLAKVAGDALYGGLWGAVSAVADVAFEAVTGRSAEQTVLAWFDSSDTQNPAPTRVAANLEAPRGTLPLPMALTVPPLPAATLAQAQEPRTDAPSSALAPAGLAAFSTALSGKGVTGDMAARALYAYRQSVLLTDASGPAPGILAIN